MQDKVKPKSKIDIVILGGGTAGWMSAAALSKLLPKNKYQITLVESVSIPPVGVGEATLPHLRFFNQRLGIDEADFMQQTHATFKIGIEFANWKQKGHAFIHPFGEYGETINNVDFHHYWTKQYLSGTSQVIDEYSLPVKMAQACKFDFPVDDQSAIRSSYGYSYHVDAGAYSQYLRRLSEAQGVKLIDAKVLDVKQKDDGHIESLVVDNGEPIEGDLFIDCSGFAGKLIKQTFESKFEDWTQWLPCNSAIAIPTQHTEKPLPYTRAIAQDAGWIWRIPLQHRLGNGQVYCDSYISKDEAMKSLMDNIQGEPIADPLAFNFAAGKPKKAWVKNCVAIGLSSGFLEPLESTTLYLIQSSIMKLIELFPSFDKNIESDLAVKAHEFNKVLDNEMLKIRDFLILHYHTTQRTDTEFWNYCRNMAVPDSLQEKIELFKEFGQVEDYKYGLFLEPSWIAIYAGMGVIPTNYDSRADLLDDVEITMRLDKIQMSVNAASAEMAIHGEFLSAYLKSNQQNKQSSKQHRSAASMNLYGRQN